jgi:hypothetical protein
MKIFIKMKAKHILSISVIALTSMLTATAQYPTALYHLESLPQSQFLNPANMPRANGFFGMPGINSVFATLNSDIAFKDALQQVAPNEWVTPLNSRFDYGELYKATGKSLDEDIRFSITPILLGFRMGDKGYFTFSYSEKGMAHLSVPRDFLKIADVGFVNGDLYNLAAFRTDVMAYRELSFGYARRWNEKLTLGINLKPLFGQVATSTQIDQFDLIIGTQQYVINTQGNIYTSLPIDVEPSDDGGFPKAIETQDLESSDYIDKYAKGFSNPGFAIDLGAQYQLNNRWVLSASLINMGRINWSRDLNSLSFNGTYSFEGVEYDATKHEDFDEAVEALIDSLETVIDYQTEHKKFGTNLSPVLHAAARYHVNHAVSLGVLSRSTFHKHNFKQEFNLSANFNFYKWMFFNASYNYRIKR